MSEDQKKPERTVADVQQEYQSGCVRAGHLQYQIVTMQKDLAILNETLRDLNFEAAGIQAKTAPKEAASV